MAHSLTRAPQGPAEARAARPLSSIQDSSKGGAVETGCSDVYDVMY